jgi:hypothetical protein
MTGNTGLPDHGDEELEALAAEMERELAATVPHDTDDLNSIEPDPETLDPSETGESETANLPDQNRDDPDVLVAELERKIAARTSASRDPDSRTARQRRETRSPSTVSPEPDAPDLMGVHRVVVGVLTGLVGLAVGGAIIFVVNVVGSFVEALGGGKSFLGAALPFAFALAALFVVSGINFARKRGPSRVMVWIAALITLPVGAYSIWVLIRTFPSRRVDHLKSVSGAE